MPFQSISNDLEVIITAGKLGILNLVNDDDLIFGSCFKAKSLLDFIGAVNSC